MRKTEGSLNRIEQIVDPFFMILAETADWMHSQSFLLPGKGKKLPPPKGGDSFFHAGRSGYLAGWLPHGADAGISFEAR